MENSLMSCLFFSQSMRVPNERTDRQRNFIAYICQAFLADRTATQYDRLLA